MLAQLKHILTRTAIPSVLLLIVLLVVVGFTGDESRMFLPIPEFRDLNITISNQVCVDQTPFLGLVLVLSHPGNTDKRQTIRATFPAAEIRPLGFRRLFVVGMMNAGLETHTMYVNVTRSNEEIRDESLAHADIMQLDHTELYNDLILKAYATYKWVAANCARARFIIKVDDDMFVDYYALSKRLRGVDLNDVDDIRGHLIVDSWNLTPYMAGGCYLTSPKTFDLLLEAARTTQPFMHLAEDVFFTGLVADKVGVKRVDVGEIRAWKGSPKCCVGQDGTVYKCEFSVFTQRPVLLALEVLRRFKEHGKSCYYFHCGSYSDLLLGDKDVKCFL